MPFTFQLFQLTNYVTVLTLIFHLPFMLAHMEVILCCSFEESSHKAVHGFITYTYSRGIFQRGAPSTLLGRLCKMSVLNDINFWITESMCFQVAVFPSVEKEVLKGIHRCRPWPSSLNHSFQKCLSCPYCIKRAAVPPAFCSVQTNSNGKLIHAPIAHLILSPLLPLPCVN